MYGEDEFNLDTDRFDECLEHILTLVPVYPSGGTKVPDVELLIATARALIAFADLRTIGMPELQDFLVGQYDLIRAANPSMPSDKCFPSMPSDKCFGLVRGGKERTKAQKEIIGALRTQDAWVSFQEIMEIRDMGNHGNMSSALNDLVNDGIVAFWRDEDDASGDNRRWRAFK